MTIGDVKSASLRIGAIIQARMGSSRLPGKAMSDLAGTPLLARLVERLRRVPELQAIVVATSTYTQDDPLAAFCETCETPVFRGSEEDVLGRYVAAAQAFELDVVVRVCADAPLTDPEGISALVEAFESSDAHFVHSRHPTGWPVGTAADLITTNALGEAARDARHPYQREHVVPFLVEHPKRFTTRLVLGPTDWLQPCYHFAVDYPEDMNWMRRLYGELGRDDVAGPEIADVLAWIRRTGSAPRLFTWPDPVKQAAK